MTTQIFYDWKPESMVEVILPEPDNFLKIRETLTRIGIAAKTENKLFQSCFILHKQGRYFIVHFLEMYILDGKRSEITIQDIERRNTIAVLLQEWNLLKIVDETKVVIRSPMSNIKIVPFTEKSKWELIQKYKIGTVKPKTKSKVIS